MMILVVAVLGLLAVMGTVYIVAARTQRSASTAMNAAYNLDLAQNAAMQQVVGVIGNSMFDSAGRVGGVDTTGTSGLAARDFDYPEIGNTTGQSSFNVHMRDEPWLVAHLHPQVAAAGNPYGAPGTTDFTVLTSALFDPNTGQYDVGYSAANMFDVVGEQTTGDTGGEGDDAPTVFDSADAYVTLLPFSEGTGIRYRVGYRIIDTSRMANLNTGCVDDAAAVGDSTGTYITSVRLAPAANVMPANAAYFNPPTDTDTALNLHTNSAGIGRAGLSTLTSTPSAWEQVLLRIENPVLADPKLTLFSLSDELELRSYGEYGTTTPIRPALSSKPTSSNFDVWPYTLNSNPTTPFSSIPSGNPARRNYTAYSFDRQFRPYLTPTDPKNPTPVDYVLVPTAGANNTDPLTVPSPYSVDSATGICDPFPASRLQQVYVNYPMSFSSAATANVSMFYMAATATNLATLMESACSPPPSTIISTSDGNPNHPNVYSHAEAVAFAANYMMYRADGMVIDTTSGLSPTANAYFLPAGPSFIDSQGMCVRTAADATTLYGRDFGPSTVATKPNLTTAGLGATASQNIICLGYAAQPFLNEVAAQEGADSSTGTPVTVIKDDAIELHNPYSIALSLKGFHLKVFPSVGGNTPNADIDLTGQYIPAKGYLVILATGGAEFSTKVSASATVVIYTPTVFTPASLDPLGGNIVLYRPYFARNTLTQQLAPIDQFSYTTLVAPAGLPDLASQQPSDLSVARINSGDATASQWGAAINTPQARANATLGAPNNNGTAGIILYDRFALNSAIAQGSAFSNINEFNQVMRLATFFDATDSANPAIPTPPNSTVPNALIPDKLPALATTATSAPYVNMDFPVDAQIHFDFLAPPYIYGTTPTSYPNPLPAGAPTKSGDIRAVHLLDQISFVDRVADTSISAASLGFTNTVDKLRIAGRINVNTASGDVLRALPILQYAKDHGLADPDVIVANILAYRDRKASATYNGKTSQKVASSLPVNYNTNYPGLGIRSLAELMIPITDALTSAPSDIETRDTIWAAAYNLCTVRSDTFVVYAYMEAVRRNPRYTGAFDNAFVWYGTGAQNVADDPNTPTAPVTDITTVPLLRVAQRRWVAIIDRSFCNYDVGSGSFTLPKVVAIKDLPQ
ncbi:MAG TPA: hypothetical protein VHQ47_05235 [Phycisphaerae bacterium]|nr:hypothetical protein [Phycisphaerae bacterium]HWC00736.1 hypothetical protein [Bryobacteraceae bacterium]